MPAANAATRISAHARDAPDSLYGPQDGLPMIVREGQYFLGYARHTNRTRMAWLAGMTDAEKSALSPSQRVCAITESFADQQLFEAETRSSILHGVAILSRRPLLSP